MRIIVTTAGSTGDVYPFLAVARLLKRRTSHDVIVIANERFRRSAEAADLTFHAHGTVEDYDRSLAPPPGSLRNPFTFVNAVGNMMYFNFFKPMQRTFELIEAHRGADSLLFAHGIAFGARLARDAFRIPLISAVMSPVGIPSNSYRGFNPFVQLLGNGFCKRNINRLCAARGLPRIGRVEGWSLSPDGIAALFPAFYDAHSDLWPTGVTAVGYHGFDTGQPDGVVEDVRRFIGSEPTILFTSGTPIRTALRLFREGVEVCRRLERKGLFVTEYSGQVPQGLPPFVKHVTYAPFRHVFPLCEAIVHHGGIGTTMECLLAGKPQLVVPQVADQPYNASRLKELNVADVLPLGRFDAATAAAKIRDLLRSNSVRTSSGCLQERMKRDDAEGNLLRMIESAVRGRPGC